MSTVLYLANRQIQAITGAGNTKKITIQKSFSGEAPDGSIINGMIMDPELFIGYMKEFWKSNNLPTKDVILVINSTKFVGKNIELPVLNEKKTLEFVEREFADVRRDEEFIYGYIPIEQTGKTRKIYAEGISPDFIRDYQDIFKEIGVKLKAVYSGESSLISLVATTAGKKYKTFVLQLADPMTLTTVLFVNGSFYYFNSIRCFHEMGSEDYANDVARSVSQIIQFMQAHQIEYPLESLIIAGIDERDISIYQEAIALHDIRVKIEVFYDKMLVCPEVDIQSYLHATSGLVVNGNMRNYLERYIACEKKEKHGDGGAGFGKSLILIGAVLMTMLTILGIFITKRYFADKQLQEIKEYNESPMVVLDVARYDALLIRNSFLTAQYNAINDISENLNTYPVCDSDVRNVIIKCASDYAKVSFSSFNSDEGYVSIAATSDTVDDINIFIKALMNEDIFSNIDYTGYTFDNAKDCWNINVTCTLSESAGRE